MSPDREAASKPDGALGSVSAVPVARILVDTGMTELHPEVADLDPRLVPLSEQAFDLAGVDVVVNTHLHFDHCGGNHLLAGRPIYVQRRELDDARSEDDYTCSRLQRGRTSKEGKRLCAGLSKKCKRSL